MDARDSTRTVCVQRLHRGANSKVWSARVRVGEITPATAAAATDLGELRKDIRDHWRSASLDLLHHLGRVCARGTARKRLPAVPLRAEDVWTMAARQHRQSVNRPRARQHAGADRRASVTQSCEQGITAHARQSEAEWRSAAIFRAHSWLANMLIGLFVPIPLCEKCLSFTFASSLAR
jgi:hypothetical protein